MHAHQSGRSGLSQPTCKRCGCVCWDMPCTLSQSASSTIRGWRRCHRPCHVHIDSCGFRSQVEPAGSVQHSQRCWDPVQDSLIPQGYNSSVDWWGLGVLLYVLLTGRQPFSSPKTVSHTPSTLLEKSSLLLVCLMDCRW